MNRGWVCGWVVAGSLAMAAGVDAQWTRADSGGCEEEWGGRDRDRHCFVMSAEFEPVSRLRVDGGTNGGVAIEGWSRDLIEVRARVWANAPDADRAREIAEAVRPTMDGGVLSADGPDTGRREGWGVSWEVRVPRSSDLDLETMNGGISVAGVEGQIDLEALNGGVRLVDVGGDVRGRTTNGGLAVELDGRRWRGVGLDLETTNGGITLAVPTDYSARLETGTVNGGFDLDFPVTVQGRIGRRLTTTLGEGGPTIRAVTTNGGVRIVRGGSAIR